MPGCNNVTLTWPAGTEVGVVAAGIFPDAALPLLSIFRADPVQGRFLGWSPSVPAFANDYTTVSTRLETVFICVTVAATLTRPA